MKRDTKAGEVTSELQRVGLGWGGSIKNSALQATAVDDLIYIPSHLGLRILRAVYKLSSACISAQMGIPSEVKCWDLFHQV